MKWYEVLIIIFGTGSLATFGQLFISDIINKKFFRFSNSYKDKLDIIREFYKLLIKAEKALSLLMSKPEPKLNIANGGTADKESQRELDEFRKNTYDIINSFFDYYDENEIVFEDEIIILVNQLREKFNKAKSSHSLATMMESARSTKVWSDAIQAKEDAQQKYVVKEIPELKIKLRTFFQKRYKILGTN